MEEAVEPNRRSLGAIPVEECGVALYALTKSLFSLA